MIETKGGQMSYRNPARAPTETPIERIFEKVLGRKMTSEERMYFHLKPKIKGPQRVSANRQSRAA
jgi:hypothetical protein